MVDVGGSRRGAKLAGEVYGEGQADHFAALADLYDPRTNPKGFINMGASLTTLVTSELRELVVAAQARAPIRLQDIHYDVNFGSKELREAIGKHWTQVMVARHRGRAVAATDVVLCPGATLALDMLAHALCDNGDVLLVPVPNYAMFGFDVGTRAGVSIVPVDAGPNLEVTALASALDEQRRKGHVVRGLLFSSPNNPVGTVYSESVLARVMAFCIERGLEIMSDEMYGETVFGSGASFVSMWDVAPDEYLAHVHVIGGFAKGLALPGFKVGMAISKNKNVISALRNLSYFGPVSNYVQRMLTGLLGLPQLNDFFVTYRKRLAESYEHVISMLSELGVATKPAQGGMFVLADFKRYLQDATFEGEATLARRMHFELKVNIAPGQAYGMTEPGWLRICYPQEAATIDELGCRLRTLSVRA